MNKPSFSKLMSGLSYPQKFTFISLIFGISLALMAYLFVKEQNKTVNSLSLEISGITYQRPLSKILESVFEHQILSDQYLKGNQDIKEQILEVQNEISSNFSQLIALDKEYELQLLTTSEELEFSRNLIIKPSSLEKKWNSLIEQVFTVTPQKNYDLHNELITSINALISYVGNSSHLFFDDVFVTYYLINSTIITLPKIQNNIVQITLLTSNYLNSETKNEKQVEKIRSHLFLTNTLLQETQNQLTLALNESRTSLKGKFNRREIQDALREYTLKAERFEIFILESIAPSEEAINNSQEVSREGFELLRSGFSLWNSSISGIETLLMLRKSELLFSQRISLGIVFLLAIGGSLTGIYFMRHISHPLVKLIEANKKLAKGDWSTRLEVIYDDEIGQVSNAFNHMVNSVSEILEQVQKAGSQLSQSSSDIATTAKEQESTVVQQEATTKEIAVTINEINATAKELATTMNEVSIVAEETSSLATKGSSDLNEMENIMKHMVESSDQFATQLTDLNEKAESITSVISTITQVADRTNLLSLNASLEASKAKDYGRGFAVIADEVRRLADQVAHAALDIERMVTEMVGSVSKSVSNVNTFSEEIRTGVQQANIVRSQLSKIIDKVQLLTSRFDAVNAGMQAQQEGRQQINESVRELSDSAQQTTNSLRQFHSTLESLKDSAYELQHTVSSLSSSEANT